MAAPKRNTQEAERDLPLIAGYYLMGIPQLKIPEMLQNDTNASYKLSQPMISNEIIKIRQRWQQSAIRNFDEAVNMELEKIDTLEREYWTAWLKSKGQKVVRTIRYNAFRQAGSRVEVTDDEEEILQEVPIDQAVMGQTEENHRIEESQGNPSYLEGVRWCINRRIVLLGLDSPTKIRFTNDSQEDESEKISDQKASLLLQILGAEKISEDEK